jgi:hypothetical protein
VTSADKKKHLSDDRENFICTTTLDKAFTLPPSFFSVNVILYSYFDDFEDTVLRFEREDFRRS